MNRQVNRSTAAFAALVLMAAIGSLPASAADDSQMLERMTAWEKAYNAGDAAGVATHYAMDATRMGYQVPAVSGRDAISDSIVQTREAGVAKVKLTLGGSETAGNMGWAHGTYTLMDADGNKLQHGKWMNVSKRIKGNWMIQADMWNTNEPDPAPAPAHNH